MCPTGVARAAKKEEDMYVRNVRESIKHNHKHNDATIPPAITIKSGQVIELHTHVLSKVQCFPGSTINLTHQGCDLPLFIRILNLSPIDARSVINTKLENAAMHAKGTALGATGHRQLASMRC
jgi:hypothetical protein